jgi:uncharacterized membrane protein YgaE (UPF0421/DUF939 family)
MASMSGEDPRSRFATLLGIQPGARVGVSFAARTTCSAVVTLLLCERLHLLDPIWAVVSAVVVILPEVRASVSSAFLRVIANLVGAGVGLSVSFLGWPSLPSLALGLPVTALGCRITGIDAAARTASVALVIVLLKDPSDVRLSSEARVGLVVVGCSVALVVTVLSSAIEKALARRARPTVGDAPPP